MTCSGSDGSGLARRERRRLQDRRPVQHGQDEGGHGAIDRRACRRRAEATRTGSRSRRGPIGSCVPARTRTRSRPVPPSPSPCAPGVTGSGCSSESRCVRFKIPRVTIADRPSGATSQSFADTNATGTDAATESSTRGRPMISISVGDRPVVDERERLVGPLVPRQTEGQGRRRTRSTPVTPTSPRMSRTSFAPVSAVSPPPIRRLSRAEPTVVLAPAVRAATSARLATRPRTCRRPAPGRCPSPHEDRDRRLDVDARCPRHASHRCHQSDHHRARDRSAVPASTTAGSCGSRVRTGSSSAPGSRSNAAERHVAIAVGVPGDHQGRRFDPAVVVERRIRAASSRHRSGARAIASSHGSFASIRRCHSSRQPSP